MSTKSQRIELLRKSAIAALNSATAAQKKWAAAVEAAGDAHIPMFLTLDRHRGIVRRMRREHDALVESTIRFFMLGPSESQRHIAEVMMMAKRHKQGEPQRRREEL